METNATNVIATGLPRSGTTLTCHLLNKVPDTVALHEPLDMEVISKLETTDAIRDEISRFFEATRKSLLTSKTAFSRGVGGKVPDNHVPDKPVTGTGLRQGDAPRQKIVFDRELSPDFLLVIKHPVLFTGMLGKLVERFACYAVIRNPLAVLGSWNSVDMPVQNGRAPFAEKVDPQLKATLDSIPDRVDRQFHLLSYFCDAYARHLPEERIIRYEEVVSTGGKTLEKITPRARLLDENLSSKNSSQLYSREKTQEIGRRLLDSEGGYWKFYTRESVEALLQ
jgi:hypothetical protein